MSLPEELRAASRKLQDDFAKRTAAFGENLDKGEAREAVVRGFLDRWLPRKYAIGRGQVIDQDGESSGQMDVVIHDDLHSVPIFRELDSPGIFPVETVFGVLQVKSLLSTTELKSAIGNVTSCLGLHREPRVQYLGNLETKNDYRPLTAIFGFTGPADPDNILRVWGERSRALPESLRPAVACVLGRGCLMYGSEGSGWSTVYRDQTIPLWVECGEDALLFFYLAICAWMADAAYLSVPNLMNYAGGPLTYPVRKFNLPA